VRNDVKIPEGLNTPAFVAAWNERLRFLEERGVPLTPEDQMRQLDLLKSMTPEAAAKEVCASMDGHPLKDQYFVEQAKNHHVNGDGKMKKKNGARPSKVATKATKVATPAVAARREPPKAAKEAKTPAPATKPVAPPKAKDGKMSALDAAAAVLKDASKPMNCKEIVEAMAAKGLWSSPAGKTPWATLNAAMLRDIKAKGAESRFRRADKGLFASA
jgi:hypothetical protein